MDLFIMQAFWFDWKRKKVKEGFGHNFCNGQNLYRKGKSDCSIIAWHPNIYLANENIFKTVCQSWILSC